LIECIGAASFLSQKVSLASFPLNRRPNGTGGNRDAIEESPRFACGRRIHPPEESKEQQPYRQREELGSRWMLLKREVHLA